MTYVSIPPSAVSTAPLPTSARLPNWLVFGVFGCSIAPWLLNTAGMSFSSIQPDHGISAAGADGALRALSGTYVHTLLEWSATATALFTALLAFTHFSIKRDVVTPIIGLALLSAGTVDAFHTLAADRLISATADNRVFIPFTWAISRSFNAAIPLCALALLFFTQKMRQGANPQHSLRFIQASAVLLGTAAYALIHFCARSKNLPQTMFPNAAITRPWDVYPLAIYALSGALIYPAFARRINSYFTMSLWLSVVPDAATQLHMALGSTALFDNHFNIAHGLKVVAYLVPCVGLVLDYIDIHRRAEYLQEIASLRADDLRLFHEVVDRMPVGATVLQRDCHSQTPNQFTILHTNVAFESMFNCERAVGQTLERCVPGPIHVALSQLATNALQFDKPQMASELESILRGQGRAVFDVKSVPLDHQRVAVIIEFVTSRIEAARHLQDTVEELRRSNADLERFAYIASHDLREPLRMVISYTELLGRKYTNKLDDKANKYINYAVDGATRMQALLDDLLKYSRVNSGKKPTLEVDTGRVLDGVLSSLKLALVETDAHVDRGPMPALQGDPVQLGQVFQNLISNALKFTDQRPQIRISARQVDAEWRFGVHDNGIGLATEHHARVFEIFSRLHARNQYPGNGVGLAIIKRIVEQHGGKVWVESTPGQGADFFFTLPATRNRAA